MRVISDYQRDCLLKIKKYANKYSSMQMWGHLFFWHFKYLVTAGLQSFYSPKKKQNIIYLGVILRGGVGDVLTQLTFLRKLLKRSGCSVEILLFTDQKLDVIETINKAFPFSWKAFHFSDLPKIRIGQQCDILLTLHVQFPIFEILDVSKVKRLSPFLLSYIQKAETWNQKHIGLVPIDSLFAAQHYCLVKAKTMLTAMDTAEMLDLNPSDILDIPISKDFTSKTLAKFGLTNKPFITVARSADINIGSTSHTRFYPKKLWENLLRLFRKQWPEYALVQLGLERNEFLSGVDIDLRGKTSFLELMTLLANAKLHLDQEGGLVHARHHLNRLPSVVLFGPTTPEVKGYCENINIRLNHCPYSVCEWLEGNTWFESCPVYGGSVCKCLTDLTGEEIISSIKRSNVMGGKNESQSIEKLVSISVD